MADETVDGWRATGRRIMGRLSRQSNPSGGRRSGVKNEGEELKKGMQGVSFCLALPGGAQREAKGRDGRDWPATGSSLPSEEGKRGRKGEVGSELH